MGLSWPKTGPGGREGGDWGSGADTCGGHLGGTVGGGQTNRVGGTIGEKAVVKAKSERAMGKGTQRWGVGRNKMFQLGSDKIVTRQNGRKSECNDCRGAREVVPLGDGREYYPVRDQEARRGAHTGRSSLAEGGAATGREAAETEPWNPGQGAKRPKWFPHVPKGGGGGEGENHKTHVNVGMGKEKEGRNMKQPRSATPSAHGMESERGARRRGRRRAGRNVRPQGRAARNPTLGRTGGGTTGETFNGGREEQQV